MEFRDYIPLEEETWKVDAACQGIDTELFFEDIPDARSYKRFVLKVCLECPVKTECLNYAVKYNLDGVWGGTSKRERIRLRKKLSL